MLGEGLIALSKYSFTSLQDVPLFAFVVHKLDIQSCEIRINDLLCEMPNDCLLSNKLFPEIKILS